MERVEFETQKVVVSETVNLAQQRLDLPVNPLHPTIGHLRHSIAQQPLGDSVPILPVSPRNNLSQFHRKSAARHNKQPLRFFCNLPVRPDAMQTGSFSVRSGHNSAADRHRSGCPPTTKGFAPCFSRPACLPHTGLIFGCPTVPSQAVCSSSGNEAGLARPCRTNSCKPSITSCCEIARGI